MSVCVIDRERQRERESGGSENKLLLETTLDIHIQTKNTHKKAIHYKQPQTPYTQSLLIHSLLTTIIEVTIQTHNYKKVQEHLNI